MKESSGAYGRQESFLRLAFENVWALRQNGVPTLFYRFAHMFFFGKVLNINLYGYGAASCSERGAVSAKSGNMQLLKRVSASSLSRKAGL